VILGCDRDKRDGVPGGDQHQYRGEEDHRAQSTAPATSGMLSLRTLHSVSVACFWAFRIRIQESEVRLRILPLFP
jgi:hypothetical protein